jgi:hypothetical protein
MSARIRSYRTRATLCYGGPSRDVASTRNHLRRVLATSDVGARYQHALAQPHPCQPAKNVPAAHSSREPQKCNWFSAAPNQPRMAKTLADKRLAAFRWATPPDGKPNGCSGALPRKPASCPLSQQACCPIRLQSAPQRSAGRAVRSGRPHTSLSVGRAPPGRPAGHHGARYVT